MSPTPAPTPTSTARSRRRRSPRRRVARAGRPCRLAPTASTPRPPTSRSSWRGRRSETPGPAGRRMARTRRRARTAHARRWAVPLRINNRTAAGAGAVPHGPRRGPPSVFSPLRRRPRSREWAPGRGAVPSTPGGPRRCRLDDGLAAGAGGPRRFLLRLDDETDAG
jgi:hypothetical protein